MGYILGTRSRKNLEGVHPDLVNVVLLAIDRSPVDFGVICGVRTLKQQEDLYAQGRTKPGPIVTWTMNSKHLIQEGTGFGHAVDLGAFVAGELRWDWPLYHKIADAMKSAAKELEVNITWGGEFKTKKDGPHFQIEIGKKNGEG